MPDKLAPKHRPINPPVETGPRGRSLPAYVSNGFIGLRVRENPLRAGLCVVSGFSGEHHERHVEAMAASPYPLAADVAVDDIWMGEQPEAVTLVDQAYDFSTAELTSRVAFQPDGHRIDLEIVTFCSRDFPTLACQQMTVRAAAACEVQVRGKIDLAEVRGRMLRRRLDTPGEPEPACDGVMLWGSHGDMSSCGLALLTEGPEQAARTQEPWDTSGPLGTTYRLRLRAGQEIVLRQIVSLVPSVMHSQPDAHAVRLIALAKDIGFDEIRARNRAAWADLWRGRIQLVGAETRWQALADAAYFYLNTSIHPASPASTSIFGLATWTDYHYYFGHVMWDIDAFAAPLATLFQPRAARALLEFRTRNLRAARDNAKLANLPGLRFPWETAPSTGHEATPGSAEGAAREDHINLHVAEAFAFHADATGDGRFLREQAWPVISGVADWIVGRVAPGADGMIDWKRVGGVAERKEPVDNDAMTNLMAKKVLERAIALAPRAGYEVDPHWGAVASRLQAPLRADGAIASHDGHRFDEEQGAAPSPLMALFPYWCEVPARAKAATLELYLRRWQEHVGAPMLAALYPTWAAWTGDRTLAARLLDEGYGAYQSGRFAQTLEYRTDKFPEAVPAGPFFANIGGFLLGLLLGLPRIRCGPEGIEAWPQGPVVLPQGWDAIECDRLWLRGRPARLRAAHGAPRSELAWADE